MITIAKRFKEIIKEKGITLEDVAVKMRIKPPSLSRAINNNTTLEMIEKIAEALNVPLIDLFAAPSDGTMGFIKHNGVIYEVNSVKDIQDLLQKIDDDESSKFREF